MKKFKEGDVVKLKAGSGRMTINGYANGKYNCLWFEGDKLRGDSFSGKILAKASKLK